MLTNLLIIQKGSSDHNTLNIWGELFGAALEKRGVTIAYVSARGSTEEFISRLTEIMADIRYDAVLAFNSDGLQELRSDGMNLWDQFRVPFFDYLVDHPLEHTYLDSSCEDYHVICVDRNHKEFVEQYYPKVKSASFLPLPGLGEAHTQPDGIEEFVSREYGLVLTAGLVKPDRYFERIRDLPEKVRIIALLWIDYMNAHPEMAPEAALKGVLDDRFGGKEISDGLYRELAETASDAILFMRSYFRQKVVEALLASGVSIDIWGNGWDDLRSQYRDSGAVFHGDVSMSETPFIYKKAKLALNILPMFKQGMHDRIATAQINGAAVITDDNGYISDLYSEKAGIFLYHMAEVESLSEQISGILTNEDTLYRTSLNGQRIAKERFSIEAVAEELWKIFQAVIP